ncbi:RNA polymerase sigma-70 factor [Chitinophaga pendula]|uniref:RNA polymerase sigma-70 factor n=1 Tax=Chitinophaga TaxID=79328 RepID=UPI000BAFA62E|nr:MULTISPECIES: RNA polymerase sigma-70 factor [Chitinophaga]ASZ11277.1 hypothetical protein CK934_10010 [Chitinophaga sp. MD30]UCJ05724.1 RNA polymerase sigma-70 factor [Chitinophaga pendula]
MGITLQELSDDMLLAACRQENVKAFDVLFDRYAARLYHYALKYIKDEAVAEETMMDLMCWVWEKRHQLNEDIRFAPYIFRAMKNAVIKVLTRKPYATLPLEEKFADEITTSAHAADQRLSDMELNEAYHEMLDGLSQQRRLVFELSRHNNLSHAEIAKETNLSLFTVKNHIKASLTHFRRHLKDHLDITTLILFCLLTH